jgi:hypothetical protein
MPPTGTTTESRGAPSSIHTWLIRARRLLPGVLPKDQTALQSTPALAQ